MRINIGFFPILIMGLGIVFVNSNSSSFPPAKNYNFHLYSCKIVVFKNLQNPVFFLDRYYKYLLSKTFKLNGGSVNIMPLAMINSNVGSSNFIDIWKKNFPPYSASVL